MGEEDLSLRLMRLRKMRELLSEKRQPQPPAEQRREPSAADLLKEYLADRGDEVLEAALSKDRSLAEQVAKSLLSALREGRIAGPITGGELLILFKRLGLKVDIERRVLVYKKGEAKELRDLLSESLKRDGG